MISRRNFVFGSAACVALAAFGISQGSRRLGYADFAGQIDTVFKVRLDSGQEVKLRLVKARLAERRPANLGARAAMDANHERFSLIFRGPERAPLDAAIHKLEHESLGRIDMYFGEIGARDGAGIRYEAVFNQAS